MDSLLTPEEIKGLVIPELTEADLREGAEGGWSIKCSLVIAQAQLDADLKDLQYIGENLCAFIGLTMLEDKEKGKWLGEQLRPLLEHIRDSCFAIDKPTLITLKDRQAERERIIEETLRSISRWLYTEEKHHEDTVLGDAFRRVGEHFRSHKTKSILVE